MKKIRPTCDQCLYHEHCYDLLDASECRDFKKNHIPELSQWIYNNYQVSAAGLCPQNNEDYAYHGFDYGEAFGRSWAAWEIAKILNIELPEPEWEDEDD